MKIKGWDIGILFLVLLAVTIGIRIYYVNNLMDDIAISEDIYSVFGDFRKAGVCLNVIFQTLTIIILFWYVYCVAEKYYCFRLGMLLAVFPAYVNKISTVDYYNLVILLLTALLVIILLANRRNKRNGNKEVLDMENNTTYTDSSMKEIVMADFEDVQVKLLDNPLPVPKRHEHKEMDYFVELTPENDDYDIKDIPEDDDFDI
jgi:hypothetical protein